MNENPNSQERTETTKIQEKLFEAPRVSKSDFMVESEMEYERKIDEKEIIRDSAFQERKEPKESDFKASGELETGYTEKSWAKPEKSMEEKATERTEEIRQERTEETRQETVEEAREREIKESKTREREEKEAREKEAREREAREREAREAKRTVYSMEKRLTKSKTDRKLFGVCGGLGEYFGIDPTLVRLAFVLLGLLHGIGLIVYIILAIIMPSQKNVEMVPSYRK